MKQRKRKPTFTSNPWFLSFQNENCRLAGNSTLQRILERVVQTLLVIEALPLRESANALDVQLRKQETITERSVRFHAFREEYKARFSGGFWEILFRPRDGTGTSAQGGGAAGLVPLGHAGKCSPGAPRSRRRFRCRRLSSRPSFLPGR